MDTLRILLLGPFRMTDGRQPLLEQALRKSQDLLALLLLSPDRRMSREAAAETLWPKAGVAASRRAVRQALWHIHTAADSGPPEQQRLVLAEGDALAVNAERPLWLDVPALDEAVQRCAGGGAALTEADLAALAGAVDLYRGPLHATCYDDWCLLPRARAQDQCITVLDVLAREHERRGAPERAIGFAQRLLDIEPAAERSHRQLMRLYAATGDRTRALRQLHRCRRALEHELGVRPEPATEELGRSIGAGASAPAVGAGVPEPIAATSSPPAAAPRQRDSDRPAWPLAGGALDAVRGELQALRRSVDALDARLAVDAPAGVELRDR